MSRVTKVLVVDDHALFREGLVHMLNQQPDFEVVGEAATVKVAVSIAQTKFPDLVMMDVDLADGDGIEAMRQILEIRRDTRIVFLTVHESEEIAFAALRRGAKGYLTKDIDTQKLLSALRAVNRGEMAISRELSSRYIEETTHWLGSRFGSGERENTLTAREVEILVEIGGGLDNETISQRLNVSPNTVKVHINNICHKLGLDTRKELLEYAQRHSQEGYKAHLFRKKNFPTELF